MSKAVRLALALGVASAALALSGCSRGSLGAAGTPVASDAVTASPTATPSPTQTSTPIAPPTIGPSPKSPPKKDPPQVAACQVPDYTMTYLPTDNTAGAAHGTLTFTNKTAKICGAYGYPDVYFYANYKQVGGFATEDTSVNPQILDLPPGSSISAPVTITDADFVDGCTRTTVTSFEVEPPGSDSWMQVIVPSQTACDNPGISLITVGAAVP